MSFIVDYLAKTNVIVDKKGNIKTVSKRYGCVVATIDPEFPDQIIIGWSKCKKGDVWNKNTGIQIALGRAHNGTGQNTVVPNDIKEAMDKMEVRAKRYFKQISAQLA